MNPSKIYPLETCAVQATDELDVLPGLSSPLISVIIKMMKCGQFIKISLEIKLIEILVLFLWRNLTNIDTYRYRHINLKKDIKMLGGPKNMYIYSLIVNNCYKR